jgi:hypothetical protein
MKGLGLTVCFLLAVVAGFGLIGCEQVEGLAGLTVTPATTVLEPPEDAVQLTASGADELQLPLVWAVENDAMGAIVSQSGRTAIYVRTARLGDSVVTVRDQFENTGSAVIRQL